MGTSRNAALGLVIATSLVLAGSPTTLAQNATVQPADSLILHGRVYTVSASKPWAEAIAIRGEKIIAVGDNTDIEKLRGANTKVIDAGGRLVLPGFTDCHIHFLKGSISLGQA